MVLERKSMPIVAWYVESNVSYMNRVIIDVLPTDWSPRKTSLNLELQRSKEEKEGKKERTGEERCG
jgi:hypothetical protein